MPTSAENDDPNYDWMDIIVVGIPLWFMTVGVWFTWYVILRIIGVI